MASPPIPGAPPLPPAAGTPGTAAAGSVNTGGGAPPPTGTPGGPPGAPGSGDAAAGGKQAIDQTIGMIRMIDKALGSLADLYGDTGGQEVAQARELLQQATSRWVAQFGADVPAVSPTDTGPSFPGGGFNNASIMPGA